MLARVGIYWASARDSLWFVPSLLTILGVSLALVAVQVDSAAPFSGQDTPFWVFGGGAEAARGLLGAIASGLITVTGVVFSITIVSVQLASSQFTPRVIDHFVSDRVNQVVLGILIGTFTYVLLVLRSVRSSSEDGQSFVPALSIAVAIALTLVGIGFLIFFINHTARAMKVSSVIDRATQEALQRIDRFFPERMDGPGGEDARLIALPGDTPEDVASEVGGYIQAVAIDSLSGLAGKRGLTIRIEPRVGEFVLPGTTLAKVWPVGSLEEETTNAICQAFVLGKERSPEQDVEYGIIQLRDIALKALSPGINDPTTAKNCLDRLAEVLVALGTRAHADTIRRDDSGRVLLVAGQTTFERAVELAFDDIRHFGAAIPSIDVKVIETVGQVAALVPSSRRAPLIQQARLVLQAAHQQVKLPEELARIAKAAEWVPREGTLARSA